MKKGLELLMHRYPLASGSGWCSSQIFWRVLTEDELDVVDETGTLDELIFVEDSEVLEETGVLDELVLLEEAAVLDDSEAGTLDELVFVDDSEMLEETWTLDEAGMLEELVLLDDSETVEELALLDEAGVLDELVFTDEDAVEATELVAVLSDALSARRTMLSGSAFRHLPLEASKHLGLPQLAL